MMRRVVVIPRGGLGNRLRVLASARTYAQQSRRTVVVLWQLTPELNCRYEDLFEADAGVRVLNEHRYVARVQESLIGLVSSCVPRAVEFVDDRTLSRLADRIAAGQDSPAAVVVASVNGSFCGNGLDPAWFVPVRELRDSIDDVCRHFTAVTVGVHIRRQDHEKAIHHSRFEDFVAAMNRHLREKPLTTFFLSSDCQETEQRMRSHFGERIMTRPKVLDRNDRAGVRDALVDLYCLSRTRLVIGSYWSSFSEAAGQLGNIPLEIAMHQ